MSESHNIILKLSVPPIILLKAIDYSGTGSWLDETDNSNNATLENGSIIKNSTGNGIILDGSTTWTFPNVMVGSAWTANVWFKQTGSQIGPGACILTQTQEPNLIIGDAAENNNNTFCGGFFSSSSFYTGSTFSLTNNRWTNIQISWDETNLNTYINGNLFQSVQPGGSSVSSDSIYRIGNGMIGEIGEVRIYNYALTQNQVITDYNSSLSTYYNVVAFVPSTTYFTHCSGMAYDNIGNLYVATYDSNTIYKINQTGYGIDFADFSLFNVVALHGMTIDLDNNLYVSAANGTIYKVDIYGNISIFNQGFSFENPWGLCFDNNGDMYVTDYLAGTIVYIYNNGTGFTTISSGLSNPQDIIYYNNNLYVTNHEDGTVISISISSPYTNTTIATLTSPTSLCLDQNNNLVVSDSDNTIYGINLTDNSVSEISTININNPLGVVFNTINNNIYVSNNGDGSILELSLSTLGVITDIYAAPGANLIQTCVTDSDGNLYTSYNNGTIYQNSTLIANIGVSTIGFITIDLAGNLYVSGGTKIYKIIADTWVVSTYYTSPTPDTNYTGILWTQLGIYVSDWNLNNLQFINNSLTNSVIASGFNKPCDIKVGPNGNIYVSNSNGIISLVNASTYIVSTFASGFKSSIGLAFDIYGNLFVTDKTAQNLYAIDRSGDSTLITSNLNNPNGIYYSSVTNTIYVCNNRNNTISTFTNYITPIPVITTKYLNTFGQLSGCGIAAQPNGTLNAIENNSLLYNIDTNRNPVLNEFFSLTNVYGICTDINGNIYATSANKIYKFNPYTNVISTYASGFTGAQGVCITSDMTIMYVVDTAINTLFKVTNNGSTLNIVLNTGLNNPTDIKLDADNFIYLADTDNHRILKINPADYSYIVFGSNIIYESPNSITFSRNNKFSSNNNLIMSDFSTNNLYSIDPSGFSTLISVNSNGYLANNLKNNIFISNNIDGSIIEIPNISINTYEQVSFQSNTNEQVLLLRASNYSNNIWLDQSGNNNNCALNTGTITVNQYDNGLIFDGSASLILSDLELGNAWTIGLWYKDTDTDFTTNIPIITQQLNNNTINAFIGGYNGNLTSGFVNNNSYKVSTNNITLTTGQWTNIQITWNGTNLITYINGVLLGTSAISSFSSSSGFSYLIGSDDDDNYITGEIGEIRAYNYALTAQQVATNYNTTYMTYLKTPFSVLIDTPVTFNAFSFSIYEESGGSTVPVLVPGLQAWYDGGDASTIITEEDTDNVIQWNDKSGNNYDGIVNDADNCPQLNITGGISFTAVDQYFDLPDKALPYGDSSYTFFIVVSDGLNGSSGGIIGGGNWGTDNEINAYSIDSNNVINIWGENDFNTSTNIQPGTNIIYSNYTSGQNRKLDLNITNLNTNVPSPITHAQTFENNRIGLAIDSYNGIINEILVFNRILTTTEKQLLEGYLAWKWNITNYLPWIHPYKFNQPSVIPSSPPTPQSFNGLVSWYDFYDSSWLEVNSDNTVTAIYDKNNDTNDLLITSTNLPTFANNKGLVLSGTNYLENNTFAQNLDTFSIYLIFEQTTKTDNAGIFSFISTTGAYDTNVNAMSFNTGKDNNNFNVATGNLQLSPTNTSITTNLYSVISSRNNGINTLNIYYNGISNGSITTSASNGTSSGFILGSRYLNSIETNGLIGTLKEIVIYNNASSTVIQQQLEGYLAWKWNIEGNLPLNHPYKNLPPGTSNKPMDPNSIRPVSAPNVWLDGTILTNTSLIWLDKSLINLNNKATYNGTSISLDNNIIPGMQSVKFLGDNKYFNDNLVINTNAYSITVVFSMDPSVNTNGRILSFYNSGLNDYNNTNSIGIGNNDGKICLYYNNTTTTLITITNNRFYILTYILDNATGNVFTYLDGVLVATNNLNININTSLLSIGGTITWKGYINEVVLYPYALRNNDRQILEGYLAWKWQLNANLPIGHPYYTIPPIVTIPSFQPNQIINLTLWNDANDLINYEYEDDQTLLSWNNRSPASGFYGNNDGTAPKFKRWGLNGLPTIKYTPTNYTLIKNLSGTGLSLNNFTFMSISRWSGGINKRVFASSGGASTIIGYDDGWKNVLFANGWYNYPSAPNTYDTPNTNWDNYCWTRDNNTSDIQFFNYDQNLLSSVTTGSYGFDRLSYNNGDGSNCEISEVLVYSQVLPRFYIQKLEGYLCWKWGLQNNLPSTHPYRFDPPNKDESLFTVKLGGWTDNLNISVLYLFDTISSTLLTSITNFYGNNAIGFYATFSYQFRQAQNYLTLCTTNNLSTGVSFVITDPLIVTPPLILSLSSNDPLNNWGYYNIAMTKSFILSSYYLGNLVNYLDYYSTMRVYYADNSEFTNLTLIGNATLTNNNGVITVNLTFTYNPAVISATTLYFYFAYSNSPSPEDTFVTNKYVFFNKNSLTFTLDHYSYYNTYTLTTNFPTGIALNGNNSLFIYYSENDPTYSNNNYANQTYITNVINYTPNTGTFNINFPNPDTGYYYMTISNKGPGIVRNSNDINVNIALPIYVNVVNVNLNHFFGFYQSVNEYIGIVGTYNGGNYPFPTIRIFYSTVIATQNSDLVELNISPLTVINYNRIYFNFDNSTLLLPSLYFYFTANTDQVPPLDSFTRTNIVTFYNKNTINFTLNHYDNTSPVFILTCLNWNSTLNAMSPLNLYILDSRQKNISYPPTPVTISLNNTVWSGTFNFDFNYLDSGTYYIAVSDSDLLSTNINYIISTPIVVTLQIPHFILQNSQYTNTQTTVSPPSINQNFLPTIIPTIALWLDSYDVSSVILSGSNVVRWNDKSGLGLNATATGTPTYNGAPAYNNGIVFSANNYFTLPNGTLPFNNTSYSYFIVAKFTNISNNYNLISGNTFNIGSNPNCIITNTLASNYIIVPNNKVIIESTYNSGGNRIMYFNSKFDISDTPGTRTQNNTNNSIGNSFNGAIYEIIVYSSNLAQYQRQQIEGYLAHKWSISLNDSPVPLQISNLSVWLDALDPLGNDISLSDESELGIWYDKSGNNNNFSSTPVKPVYKYDLFGSLPGIDFISNSGFKSQNSITYTLNLSIAMVVNVKNSMETWSSLYTIGGRTTRMSIGRYGGIDALNFQIAGTSFVIENWIANTPIILYGTVTNGINVNFNIITTTDTYTVTGTTTISNNTVGSYSAYVGTNETNNYCNSYIGEIIYYNKVLSGGEQTKIISYLTSRWFEPLHPYYSIPPPILYRISEPEPPVFFNPTQLPNLSLWLDGADLSNVVLSGSTKNVITWNDKSGLGRNATAVNTPQWQVDFGISFDGTSSYFTLPNNTLPTGNNIYSYFILASFTGSGNYGLISGGDQTAPNNKFGLQTNNNKIVTTWYQNDLTSNYSYTINTPILIESIYDGTNRKIYFNSNLDKTDTPGSRSQSNSNNVLGSAMNGIIYEVVVYSSVLTDSQRSQMEVYLINKWIPFVNPASLPNLTHWIDASDITTLFQDTEGTVPVTVATDPINYVKDKSFNKYNMNTDEYNPPSYNTLNSLPAISLTPGTNLITISQVPKTDTLTVFWVGSLQIAYETSVWSHSSDGNINFNDISIRKWDNYGFVNFGSYDSSSCLLPIMTPDAPLMLWGTMKDGITMVFHAIYPGGIYKTASYNDPSKEWQPGDANIYLNSIDFSNEYSSSYLSENIYYQRLLSTSEINNILNYLGSKWNITIPTQFKLNAELAEPLAVAFAEPLTEPLIEPLIEPLALSQPILPSYSSNQSITLTLSTYYPEVYLYYGTTDTSFYDLNDINNPITEDNIHTVNPDDNTITFNIGELTDAGDIIYFYASTEEYYTGVLGMSLPFSYADYSSINATLDHYDITTNVYNVTITNYNPLLINQQLYVLAIQNNTNYINTEQTLTLSSLNNSNLNYTSQFTYTFPSYNIFNVVLCNSFDMTNQPDGDIYYQISENIYSFTLTASLSNSDLYPGVNSKIINLTIPGLSPNLCVSNLIPYGNILINNSLMPNKYTITVNQMNINIYKYQNNGFTIWLDAKDPTSITYDVNKNVSEWNDKSGSINNGTNDDTDYQPMYNSSTNNIWFKGYNEDVDNQYLDLPFTTFNNTSYYTCSFVFTHTGYDSNIMAKQSDEVDTYAFGSLVGGGQIFRWSPVVGQNYDSNGAFQTGNKYIVTFTYDGINYRSWINGKLITTTATANAAIPNDLDVTTCTLGSLYSPQLGYGDVNIKIHEFIFNETYLYDTEIQKIEAYLTNKWSVNNTSTNPYLNTIISFSPNDNVITDTITFATTDNVINVPNTVTGILINPVLTLDTDISANYIITLDDWNSSITTVYLYGGTNSKYYNRTMLAQLSVTYDSNGYYIIVTVNPLPANNYYSIRDTNSSVFNFDLRVSGPNNNLNLRSTLSNYNIETSPSDMILNKDNKIVLTLPDISSKLYVYTCETLYTTGVVGTGDRDLTFNTILTDEQEIIVNPKKLPLYILISTEDNYTGVYYQSNIITNQDLTLRKITKLNGIIDQVNKFSIVLDDKYKNIQVNDSNVIIKHVINKNNIEFNYDPGFELNATFNIINSMSNEIYEIIEVIFIDPKI
jgi:streptogramin lyase